MSFSQNSLIRRIVIIQIIMILGFSFLLMSNLLWFLVFEENDDFLLHNSKSIAISPTAEKRTLPETKVVIAAIDRAMTEANVMDKKERDIDPEKGVSVIRVTDAVGGEIYTSPGYSSMPFDLTAQQAYNFSFQGKDWRALSYISNEYQLVVHIAQTTDFYKDQFSSMVKRFILLPLVWFLPLAAVASFLVVMHSFRPLRALENAIAQRSPTDLKPLHHISPYAETKPLVNEINSLLQKLDTTIQRERQFLADAAHELRTPLAVIQAQAHVLTHANNVYDIAQASKDLNQGIERAANLIQKLLLTAKVSVDSFKIHLEDVDLSDFVQDRMANLSVLAAQKNIDLELSALPSCIVKIDPETFISAVDNVLDNAIRYTPEGGNIQVDISLPRPDRVQLRVTDNGIGVPPDLYQSIFERFFRVSGTEQQGSGLGLSIVQRVMKLHGGDIAIAPGLNQRGLSVALTLPKQA